MLAPSRLKTCQTNFKYFIHFTLTILTGYLLFQELTLYLSIPVHMSKYKKLFSSEQFPDIIVCHIPGFRLKQLWKNGYRGSFKYLLGEINNSTEGGWIGKSTGSLEELVQKISTISSVKDCPGIALRNYNKYDKQSTIELTPAFHPQGQCCRASFSQENMDSKYEAIMIGYLHNVTKRKSLKKCRVFLSNRKSASFFHLNDYNMDTSLDFSKGQLRIVKVTVSEEHYLKDHPSFNCKNYLHDNEYHEVPELLIKKTYSCTFFIFSALKKTLFPRQSSS